MTKKMITESAVFQRLNRFLGRSGQGLRKCPYNGRGFNELGRYYIIDLNGDFVDSTHCDIVEYSTELGLIQDWEAVEVQDV